MYYILTLFKIYTYKQRALGGEYPSRKWKGGGGSVSFGFQIHYKNINKTMSLNSNKYIFRTLYNNNNKQTKLNNYNIRE